MFNLLELVLGLLMLVILLCLKHHVIIKMVALGVIMQIVALVHLFVQIKEVKQLVRQ
jgi:hypothetical protein